MAERILAAEHALGKKKTSGRVNLQYAAEENPMYRWPNEAFNVGSETRKRPSYQSLTLGQFVWGFVKNVNDMSVKNRMLEGGSTVS